MGENLADSTLRLESNAPCLTPAELLLFTCVRNERLRLPHFLEYHRNLGVTRFFIVDNDSDDGTRQFLSHQNDITLYSTTESYANSRCGIDWLNTLLDIYARDHWTLILDADELFCYPFCETKNLSQLTNYLDGSGEEAVIAPLLDMYSNRPISETGYVAGKPFLDVCRYFDGDSYEYYTDPANGLKIHSRGGARHRLFWENRDREYPSPFLLKIPLVKWRRGLALEASTHFMRGAKLSRLSGVLLHFKFLQDFPERARTEARRKEHFAQARQYAIYADTLDTAPAICAYHEGSIRYQDSRQLLDLGFMRAPPDYSKSIENNSKS